MNLELKTDECKLNKLLCDDNFLSPLVHVGEIITLKKGGSSFALHKRTGVIITFEIIYKNNKKNSYIIKLKSGNFSYAMKPCPSEGMVIGISKYRDLILNRTLQGNEMIQTEDNIDQFRNCTAVVLSILYQNFQTQWKSMPSSKGFEKKKRVLVNYDDEVSIWNKNGYTSENHPMKDAIAVYKNTIRFLYNEGYIRCLESDLGNDQRKFDNCVLTSKGLVALGKIDVERKISWGDKIYTALKDNKYTVIQGVAQKFIMEVLLP